MRTMYCVTIRLHTSGVEHTIRHDSATARALTIISLTPYVDIVREFLEHGE